MMRVYSSIYRSGLPNISAAIWVVVKHLHPGFRHRICPAMLVRFKIGPEMPVRVTFGLAAFKSLPILHGFGDLGAFRMPVARDASKFPFAGERKTADSAWLFETDERR